MKVRIHTKRPTPRNPQVVVAAILGNPNDQKTFSRIFRHHGIETTWITERDMTQAEKDKFTLSWRLQWYSYKTWEGLIEDEWMITDSYDWITSLHELSGLKIPLDEIIKNL